MTTHYYTAPSLDGYIAIPENERGIGEPLSCRTGVAATAFVAFHTAVAIARHDGPLLTALDTTLVHFRDLTLEEITRYVDTEHPLDCAGSFKTEGLGIALFAAIDSRDPTALSGMPLIEAARLLREAGYHLP